jgi:hypothetical protein
MLGCLKRPSPWPANSYGPSGYQETHAPEARRCRVLAASWVPAAAPSGRGLCRYLRLCGRGDGSAPHTACGAVTFALAHAAVRHGRCSRATSRLPPIDLCHGRAERVPCTCALQARGRGSPGPSDMTSDVGRGADVSGHSQVRAPGRRPPRSSATPSTFRDLGVTRMHSLRA